MRVMNFFLCLLFDSSIVKPDVWCTVLDTVFDYGFLFFLLCGEPFAFEYLLTVT